MVPRSAPPPLHPDLRALLGACRSAPADDVPRLVLADWLDDHADAAGLPSADDARARAALIRVQVELARPTCDEARLAQLRAQEAALLIAHAADWLGDLAETLDHLRGRPFGFGANLPARARPPFQLDPLATRGGWRFARGLLRVDLEIGELRNRALGAWFGSPLAEWVSEAGVALSGVEALERLEVPGALAPYLGVWYSIGAAVYPSMRLPNPAPEALTAARCKRLLKCANFAFVRALTVMPPAVEAGLLPLLPAAPVGGLRYLSIRAPVRDTGAALVARAALDNLSALDASACEIGAGGLAQLAASPHLGQLVALTAFRNPFGCDGAAALAASPLASRLRTLELQNTGIGDRGTAALAVSPLLDRLTGPGLNLSMNPLADAGAAALAACPHLARFTELILRECRVSDKGAKALADSPHVTNVAYLDLWKNRVGDAGARALASAEHLARVRELSLRDNALGPKGRAALAARFGPRAMV